MRKILLAQDTPGLIPPIEDMFACMTPRITGKEPLPRISCVIGGEEGTTQETPFQIECLAPRFACMLGLGETTAGLGLGLGDIMKKKISMSKIKVLGSKLGIGIPLGNTSAQPQQRARSLQRQNPMQRQQAGQKQAPSGVGSELVIRA